MSTYSEHLPPAALAPYIECLWTAAPGPSRVQSVTPDGCMDILLRIERSGIRSEVVGAMTRPHRVTVEAGTRFLGIRFRPGMAASVLHVNGASLTDKTIALEALWRGSAESFGRKLHAAESAEERNLLLERMLTFGRALPPAQRGIGLIVQRHGQASLEEICDTAHLGERQFRRYCLERTGLSPKLLARVVRFRHARQMVESTPAASLSQIAVDAGYFDQAHMIRDFRALGGVTPARVRADAQSPIFPILGGQMQLCRED